MSRTRDTLRTFREDWSAAAPVILYDAQGNVKETLTANEFKATRRSACRRHHLSHCGVCSPAMPDRVKPEPSIGMTWLERLPAGRSGIARKAAVMRWKKKSKA